MLDKNKYKEVSNRLTSLTKTWPSKGEELKTGDSVEGEFVEKIEGIGENNSSVYVLKTKDNELIGVWNSTVLDTKFSNLKGGQRVGVEYLGEKKGQTGRTYKDFFVGVKEGEVELD